MHAFFLSVAAVLPTAELLFLLLEKLEKPPYNMHAFVGFL